jgi:hypothetical protein
MTHAKGGDLDGTQLFRSSVFYFHKAELVAALFGAEARKKKVCELDDFFTGSWWAGNRQRTFARRSVLILEEKERDAGEVVAMVVADENGVDFRRRIPDLFHRR